MYRFLWTPKWIAGHLLLVVMVTFFVWAGFWQLSRLDEARATRERGEERVTAPAVPLEEAIEETGGSPDAMVYRRVVVTGEYRTDLEVATAPRTREQGPGLLLLTPLQPSDGSPAVLVERGWVPYTREAVPRAMTAPPDGEVQVTGILLPPEAPGADPFNEAGSVRYINPSEMAGDLGLDLRPLSLRLLEQDPSQENLPVAGSVPSFDEGNHLSYSIQWFSFAAVSLIGYPILLRRVSREHRAAAAPVGKRAP